jgi:hypothetical protein
MASKWPTCNRRIYHQGTALFRVGIRVSFGLDFCYRVRIFHPLLPKNGPRTPAVTMSGRSICQYQLKNPHSAELKIPHLAGGDGLQFQPADRSYAQSFPLEFLDLIHVSTSQQCQPSSASRIGPVAHRRRVVDFSTSIMGIFASAVTRLRAPAVW